MPGVGRPGLHVTSRNRACLLASSADLAAPCVTVRLSLLFAGWVSLARLVSGGGGNVSPRISDLGGGAHSTL